MINLNVIVTTFKKSPGQFIQVNLCILQTEIICSIKMLFHESAPAQSSIHDYSAFGPESVYTNDRDEGKFCFNPLFFI